MPRKCIRRPCEYCGAEFVRYTNLDTRFCSHLCANRSRARPLVQDFWARVDMDGPNGCWLWAGYRDGSGYGLLFSGPQRLRVHRFSWELHNGPIPPGLLVCHRCDNPPCVNPAHLWLGTIPDNTRDMDAKGRRKSGNGHGDHPERAARGERVAGCKLTTDQVREMRRLHTAGLNTFEDLAHIYGVNPSTAARAIRGETWRHIGKAG